MDLTAGFDWPNPFGLKAVDFEYDMDGYDAALQFLSDLSSGTEEKRALEVNGGSEAMLREWERSPKFRRVLHKCRNAGAEERRYMERTEAEALTADAPGSRPGFIPLDQMPVRRPSVFSSTPDPGSFGDGSLNLPG